MRRPPGVPWTPPDFQAAAGGDAWWSQARLPGLSRWGSKFRDAQAAAKQHVGGATRDRALRTQQSAAGREWEGALQLGEHPPRWGTGAHTSRRPGQRLLPPAGLGNVTFPGPRWKGQEASPPSWTITGLAVSRAPGHPTHRKRETWKDHRASKCHAVSGQSPRRSRGWQHYPAPTR